jgi:hypothetical protein
MLFRLFIFLVFFFAFLFLLFLLLLIFYFILCQHPTDLKPMTSIVANETNSFVLPSEYSLEPFPDRFLGLDINTNHTGFTLLDKEGKCIECGVFNTENLTNVFEKAWFVSKCLKELKERTDEKSTSSTTKTEATSSPRWIIAVEDFLKGFFGATFQVQHLFTLAQMNSLICQESKTYFGMIPERIHVHRARALFGLKPEKKKVKETVQAFVAARLPEYDWKIRGSGNLVKWCYDVADSYLIAGFMYEAFKMAKNENLNFVKMPESAWKKQRKQKQKNIAEKAVAGKRRVKKEKEDALHNEKELEKLEKLEESEKPKKKENKRKLNKVVTKQNS